MSDLTNIIKTFLLAIIPFLVTPYVIKNDKAEISFKQKWMSILFLNFSAIYFMYKYSYELAPSNLEKNPYLFLGYLRSIFLSISVFIISIMISKNHEKIAKCTTKLLELNKKLKIQQFRKIKVILSVQVFLLYTSVVSILFTNLLKPAMSVYYRISQAFLSTATMFGSMVGEYYFINSIVILYFCTNVLHKKLKEFKTSNLAIEESFSSTFKIKSSECAGLKLKNLRKVYEEILDAKDSINKAYSFFLTVRICNLFLEMVYFLFLNIIQFQFRQNSALTGTLPGTLIIIYPLTILVDFLTLAICGELLSRQGTKTAVIVHRLISQISDSSCLCELNTFSQELTHRTLKISVGGFCDLDFTLVGSMLGAVSMYLIILFQFQFDVKGENPVYDLLYHALF